MRRALIVFGITHLVAALLPVVLLALTVGWFIKEPAVQFAGFGFTCNAGMTRDGWVTGCFWQVPW